MRCKDLEDKMCLLLGPGTSRDLGKGTQCILKYISLTLIPSQMHCDLEVFGKCCSFQSGPVLSHEHGHQWLLAWKQVPQTASHPQTRACFFCSPAWPTAGFSNHVGRRDEGPEVSHIIPHTLVGCCYCFLNNFAIQHVGADKAGRAREISQHMEEACPSPPEKRNEAEIHSQVCLTSVIPPLSSP